ncbi:MAG: hypothetical protein RL368_1959 [Pseudomonadota bacterium]|jgi:hypothetical protein
MAFYIKLNKTFENSQIVRYTFGSDDTNLGELAIDKINGEVTLLKPIKNDDRCALFNRAGAKIRKEWKEGRFPDLTEWAS